MQWPHCLISCPWFGVEVNVERERGCAREGGSFVWQSQDATELESLYLSLPPNSAPKSTMCNLQLLHRSQHVRDRLCKAMGKEWHVVIRIWVVARNEVHLPHLRKIQGYGRAENWSRDWNLFKFKLLGRRKLLLNISQVFSTQWLNSGLKMSGLIFILVFRLICWKTPENMAGSTVVVIA